LEQLNFRLEVFEGPLDLLLHLISKHKLNIVDIEITSLLEQYLDYIEQMKLADLDVASEFLEMAARLVYIKTVSLLPKHEEAETLKRELTGELLELSAIKYVAQKLSRMDRGYRVFVRKPVELPVDRTYSREHDPEELLTAYFAVAGRKQRKLPPPVSEFTPLVNKRIVSVESRISHLLKKLYKEGQASLSDCYRCSDRSELVATFLAVLELVKSKRLSLNDENTVIYFNHEYKEEAVSDGNQQI